ncbi:UvrD-helicase domain-containing protein, partial [Candidatus Gracilibacteria bacterium]|nr:UvrD-helicase domain-containing protein [Candidatus Gracilibacteria bacterium]
EYIDGPLLILAGAGAGKTHTLTERVSFMIKEKGIDPTNIVCVTFTNKAASEMRERISKTLGINFENNSLYRNRGLPFIATFHSMGVFLLRQFINKIGYDKNFVIYDEDDKNRIIKDLLEEKNIDIKEFNFRKIAGAISSAKNSLKSPESYSYSAINNFQSVVSDIYIDYEKQLKSFNALDFDDILLKTLEIIKNKDVLEILQERYKYFLVDEYQDTNEIQYNIMKILASKTKNICVVGDDWQGIYSWRGANIANIFNFEKDYKDCKIIKLEQNYRSTQNIISGANFVIKNNIGIMDKTLWTDNKIGEKIKLVETQNEINEAEKIADLILEIIDSQSGLEGQKGSTAILYRTNGQSRVLEEALIKKGVPYIVYGGVKFYERKEIKDIMAYLRLLSNPNDLVSLKRIINVPSRKIGAKSVEVLFNFARNNNLSPFDVMSNIDSIPGFTPQARKGIEFFYEQFKEFNKLSTQECTKNLMKFVISKIGYQDYLKEEYSEEEYETKLDNVIEFQNMASRYDGLDPSESLNLFLEDIALITDSDNIDEKSTSRVSLMTIHLSKGLEFDNVFISGVEEGIFPHSRTFFAEKELEEERRLMYVAMTRAKNNLYITRARERYMFGNYSANPCSRFIKEIPENLVERVENVDFYSKSIYNQFNVYLSNKIDFDKEISLKPKVRKLVQNDVSAFSLGDKINHVKFGEGTIVSLSGKIADIAFGGGYGIKKMNIELAPIEKM